jgi:nitrogen regulatory protein P-II 1
MHSKVIKMEIVCEKEDVDKIVNIIQVNARTGKSGDGLIYVSDVEKRIKIRTGEKESR